MNANEAYQLHHGYAKCPHCNEYIHHLMASYRKTVARELLKEVHDVLFVADTLTEQDLKRGFMAIKHPEVWKLYQDDMRLRMEKFNHLTSKYLEGDKNV